MLVREVIRDAKTGEVTERMVDMPDVLTVEQGMVVTTQLAQLDTNARTLADQADAALTALRTYRDIASPTNAQTTAQVKLQARVLIGIIRLLRQKFDGTD